MTNRPFVFMPHGRKINRRRLMLTLLAVGILGGTAAGGFVIRREQIERKFRQMRADGLAADARHDAPAAVNLLGQYLARYPDDVEALTRYSDDRLAVPLPDDMQRGMAIQTLRYVLHLDPTLEPQRRTLMQLYLQTGYWTEALDTADVLLAGESAAAARTDRTSLAARATALVELRRLPEADTADDAWCAADPASVEARLIRLDLARVDGESGLQINSRLRDWTAAGRLTPAAVDLLKGHARLIDSDPGSARALLIAAAGDSPFDPGSAGPLIRDLDRVGLPDVSLTVARARRAADPSDPAVTADLIRREWIARQFQKVVDLARSMPDRTRLPVESLGLEAVAYSELGRAEMIPPILKELQARPDPVARAWAAVAGQLASKQFEPEKLIATCGAALSRTDGPILRYYVGESFLTLGDRGRAEREWEQTVATDPSWPLPAVRLCRLLTEDGKPKPALVAGREAVRLEPHDPEAATALAAAWAAAVVAGQDSDSDGCLHLLDQLITQLPADVELPVLRATLLAHQGKDSETAVSISRILADPRPLPEQSWYRLAAASTAAHQGLEQQCLDRCRSEHGITPRSAYARAVSIHFADLPSASGTTRPTSTGTDAGIAAFDLDRAAAAGSTAAADTGWAVARAEFLDVIGDPSAAASWAAAADTYPVDLNVQRLVCATNAARSDPALMTRVTARILALTGAESPVYQVARARYLVTFGNTPAEAADARVLLDNVLRSVPDSAEACELSAVSNEKNGRPAAAITDLRAALTIDPSSDADRLSLARLLQSQGDFQAAFDELGRLNLARLTGDDQRQLAAYLLYQHGDTDRAIGLLSDRTRPGSATGQLLLALFYRQSGRADRALDIVNKLLDAGPDSAAVAFGADLLAAQGRTDEAHALLSRLDDSTAGGKQSAAADLVRGAFLLRWELPAKSEMAAGMFAAATAADPSNPVSWRSRVAAELSLGRTDRAVAAASDGARQIPADPVLMFFIDNAPAVKAAAADPTAVPLLLAVARDARAVSDLAEAVTAVAAVWTENRSTDWLANRLGDLSRRHPDSLPLALYLIAVDERAGRTDDAAAVAVRTARSFPGDPAVFRAEISALSKCGQWAEILAAAGTWKRQLADDALEADLTAADALIRLNRPLEVAALLKGYTEHPNDRGFPEASVLVGRARVAGGETGVIVQMEPLLTHGPAGRAAWMQFAVELLPADQAAVEIRRAIELMKPTDPVEHVTASEMWARLADRSGDPKYATEAVSVIGPFLTDPSASAQVLIAGASWSEKTGDVPKAESLYRRVLVAVPNQPMAVNNLAMILARSDRAAEAVPMIDRLIAVIPLNAGLHDTRAFALRRDGKTVAALAEIDRAIALDPTKVVYRVRRIEFFVAAGRTEEAATANHQMQGQYPDRSLLTPEVQRLLEHADQIANGAKP